MSLKAYFKGNLNKQTREREKGKKNDKRQEKEKILDLLISSFSRPIVTLTTLFNLLFFS